MYGTGGRRPAVTRPFPGAAGASWVRRAAQDASVNPQSITVEGYGVVYLYWGTQDTQTLGASGEALLDRWWAPQHRRQAVAVMKRSLRP